MYNFITDRTAADVERLKELKTKILAGTATDDESAEYNQYSKGACNYTDLNRIETALHDLLGLEMHTWSHGEIVTETNLNKIAQRILQTASLAYEKGLTADDITRARAFFLFPEYRSWYWLNFTEKYLKILTGE